MLPLSNRSVSKPIGEFSEQTGGIRFPRLGFATLLAALFVLSAFVAPPALAQDQDDVKGMPAEPSDAQEIRRQIGAVEKIRDTLPDRGAPLFFLAMAKIHLHETREALALLKECLALQEGFDPSGDPAFMGLKESKDFSTLMEGVHREFPGVFDAREAFRTTEKDLIAEGIAYDTKRDSFYLSSLNRRKIVTAGHNGDFSDFVPADRYGLLPVFGIKVDASDDTVWAASFADSGQSELLHFDGTGKLLGRFKPTDSSKHGFNDLVVRGTIEILTTDSVAGQVLRFDRSTHAFKALPVDRALFYPNGIALADDGHSLYVSDTLGVVKIDLSTGRSSDVNPGQRNTLAGIDGLYWYKGSLVGIQNAIGSPRVAEFRLSKDGLRVTRSTVLENHSRFCAFPTTGAIRGSDFFFIANSGIDNLNDGKVMDVTRLEATRVGVLHLP